MSAQLLSDGCDNLGCLFVMIKSIHGQLADCFATDRERLLDGSRNISAAIRGERLNLHQVEHIARSFIGA